jgi:hypothetical protein
MIIPFEQYTVNLVDDPSFKPGSADNLFNYDNIYYDEKQFQPTSKHGIRVTRSEQSFASAIICETGGGTTIHENSFILKNDNLLICCCAKVYSFKLPELTLNWKKRFDTATCFAIHPFKKDFIIHGELEIKRIDIEGNVKWDFSARDIFVTQDGTEAMRLFEDRIELTDWEGDKYVLDEYGKVM